MAAAAVVADHDRVNFTCVTVDCADPAAVAVFWSEALRWEAPAIAPDGTGAVVRSPGGGPYLEFVQVPEPKANKNRVHLGCSVASLADLEVELERLARLGATVAWEEEFPRVVAARYRNVILRDVEGNEFCLGGGRYPGDGDAAATSGQDR